MRCLQDMEDTMRQLHSEATSKRRSQFPPTCSLGFSVFLFNSLVVFSSPIKLSSFFMNACKHLIATGPCGKDFQSLTGPCVKSALLSRVGGGDGHREQAAPRLFHLLCSFLQCKRLRKVCSLSFLQVACDFVGLS